MSQGSSILTDRYKNRGTGFTEAQREQLRILGRLPPRVETIDEQVARSIHQFRLFEKPINKYQMLAQLHTTNTTLYYKVILTHLLETLPVIYTPTVGEACQKFGSLFFRERGVYMNKRLAGRFKEVLAESCYTDVDVIVITDGSRILGLGDLGSNGMGISIGKCSLYVVGAGLSPRRVLPIIMDCGTNNETLLADPFYLGIREKRCNDEEFYGLMDEFMQAVQDVYPTATVQFEDFSNNHCFDVLARYQSKYRCFNDDIQGTGAVIAAGFVNAVKRSRIAPLEQRTLVFGAGSAAVGVALAIADLVTKQYGVDRQAVVNTFYLVDTKGLVAMARGDTLQAHKVALARHDVTAEQCAHLKELHDVVTFVKPTAFLGLGGVGPVLTKEMVEFMCTYCASPIIFPLSNPTSKAEIVPSDAYAWSKGTAIVASGSPFPECVINGVTLKPSQGNNMYVFPGIGLGCTVARPSHIPDALLLAASNRLNTLLTDADAAAGSLYPPLTEIRNVSQHIATAVVLECQALGIATAADLPTTYDEVFAFVGTQMWQPEYTAEIVE